MKDVRCVIGWHSWPRWTRRKHAPPNLDQVVVVYVRICRRCGKRVTR